MVNDCDWVGDGKTFGVISFIMFCKWASIFSSVSRISKYIFSRKLYIDKYFSLRSNMTSNDVAYSPVKGTILIDKVNEYPSNRFSVVNPNVIVSGYASDSISI